MLVRVVSFLTWSSVVFHTVTSMAPPLRCFMYLTGQHDIIPPLSQLHRVTHVALAFMSASYFHEDERTDWPIFRTVDDTRKVFPDGTKVIIAIGGWGDTADFVQAARTAETRQHFANNIARMVQATGADGIDADWEYPGGNGDDYKLVPNSSKAWEIDAYLDLIEKIRTALGPDKLLTAAIPGLERDMLAFTPETMPTLNQHIDFFNVMTYEMLNRRDNITTHHTGIQNSIISINNYMARGIPASKLNLGFGFFAKWAKTEHVACKGKGKVNAIGCPTLLLEDPVTGADMGRCGGFAWNDAVPGDKAASFAKALKYGEYDEVGGGHYYWDEEEDLWWTFDTPDAIVRKFGSVVAEKALGGVFAWGLGEDAPKFEHFAALNEGLKSLDGRVGRKDEL